MTEADREHIPVLCVQMPSDPSVLRFYIALLAALGAPPQPRLRLADVEQMSLSLLRSTGVRMLVIDELHNVLAGPGSGLPDDPLQQVAITRSVHVVVTANHGVLPQVGGYSQLMSAAFPEW